MAAPDRHGGPVRECWCLQFPHEDGGTSASGRTLSGYLDGRSIDFKARDGLECRGSYKHGFFGGEGSVRCSDGRTGTVSMVSTQSLLGPGHSEGRGEGMIGDERFAFTY
ncbi:hypothetical protein [Methylobacterium tarhaniae]|uniref:hypothetical protein n=1 Tax=Methylobacterium tarhaniae TaxID=1187852 RepID=UPI003D03F00E